MFDIDDDDFDFEDLDDDELELTLILKICDAILCIRPNHPFLPSLHGNS